MVAGIRPETVAEVLETLDGKKEELDIGTPMFAQELTEEEMQTYVPFSMQESDEAVALLRRYGVAVQDVPDR